MNYKTLRSFALLIVVILFTSAAHGGIAVKPANVTVDLGKGRPTGRFVISNTGDTEERYRVRAAHFAYSLDGKLQLVPPDQRSLATWVKFNPKEFTLPPHSKRAVRFVVLPRIPLSDGEYWGAMELESLNTSTATSNDKEGRNVKIKIIPSVLVPIFGRAGEVHHDAVLEQLVIKRTDYGAALSVIVTNTGQARLFVRGKYSVVDDSDVEVMAGTMPRGLVLPGNSRRFETLSETKLPSGRYTVRVEYGAEPLAGRKLAHEESFVIH